MEQPDVHRLDGDQPVGQHNAGAARAQERDQRGRRTRPAPVVAGDARRKAPLPGAYGRRVTSYRQPGTVLTDHTFRVPLDYDRPDGEHIEVFAREVVAAGKADADLPWLLFLQGGPGFGAQASLESGLLGPVTVVSVVAR